jgi:2,3-bisphosphoglycerate-dependent phosphoglycerate mutase
MKIFLVRHGESIDDIENCYGGASDFSLTESGRKTAEELASRLANAGIQRLFSSPYKRAQETAEIIAKKLGVEVETINDFRERNSYGVLSGVNKTKAKEIFPLVFAALEKKPGDYYSDEVIPGEEPRDEFNARVKNVFVEVTSSAANNDVICIVTHGNVTRAMYRHVLGVEGKVSLDLLAVTVINYDPALIEIESKEGVEIK